MGAVVQIARQPSFFGAGRAPDTLAGRFELMTLHASLALIRLRAEPALAPLAQAFTDKLFRSFDAGLREDGVGDLTVPKRMRKIASDFYGRLNAYAAGLEGPDAALATALARNGAAGEGFSPTLAAYAIAARQSQAVRPAADLMRLDGWPAAPD
ncbi:ubiquinol-cytochrome C chaperone [alpha proteobacterium U9-1i]|nr:ubiquinol-cytochrome C chaperone [alpha proteobacterium U9-1i]